MTAVILSAEVIPDPVDMLPTIRAATQAFVVTTCNGDSKRKAPANRPPPILVAPWCPTFGAAIPILHNLTGLVDCESCRADDLALQSSRIFNDAAACL